MNSLFWILILLIPSQLGKHWWPEWSLVNGIRVDYLSPTIYLTDILILLLWVLLARTNKTNKTDRTNLTNIPLLFLISYLLLVVLTAPRPWLAVYWLFRYLEIPLVAWAVNKQKTKIKKQISQALALGIVFSVGLGAAQMILGKTTGWFWWLGERNFSVGAPGVATLGIDGKQILRAYATFPHPNALAGWLATAGLIIAVINKSTRSLANRLRLAEFFSVAGTIMTASRTAIVGLAIGWLMIFPIGNFFSAVRVMVVFPKEALFERLVLGRAAWQMIIDHPVLGVGPGQFLARLPEYLPAGFYKIQPVHNVFLLILAEFGVVGGLISLIGLIWLIRRIKSIPKWLPVLTVLLITGMGDHYWLTAQQNRLLLGVVFGLLFLRSHN